MLSQFVSSENKGINDLRGSVTNCVSTLERTIQSTTENMGPPYRRNSHPITITNNNRPPLKHTNNGRTSSTISDSSYGSCSSPNTVNTAWNLGVQRRDRKLWTTLRERIEADIGVETLTTVELEDILKQMLSVTLPNPSIHSEEIASVMTALAQDLPISSGLLCSEFTRFVHKVCTKEKILLTSTQLNGLLQFFLSFIKTTATWYTAGAIRALGLLLHDNADHIVTTEKFENLFAVLLQYLDPSGVDIEARYAATSCVSSICIPAAQSPHIDGYFASLLKMVVENVRQQSQRLMKGENERMVVKACTCSLKCIYTIVSVHYERLADRIEAELPSLLCSMRQVLGHGLILTPTSDQGHERVTSKMVFTYQNELPPSDSDSSLCGSDGGGKGGQSGDGLLARLRITVLHTVEAIAQHFPRAITSSVGLYLPEQTTPFMTLYKHTPSVLTLLIADPCERVRIAAARFLDAFWDQIPLKQYFRHSLSVVAPSTSFASMPKRISLMLYQVHVTLVYAIQSEKEGASLIQVLKTTSSVIQHCPYASILALLNHNELQPPLDDVLKALASSLYAATSSSDHSIRMASIACFSALLNVNDTISALSTWMISRTSVKTTMNIADITIVCGTSSLSKRSFIEELLIIASRPDDASRTLMRLEAMSLLSKIAKNYSMALSTHWKRLQEFMLGSFQDMDPNVRLQAVKILENYIKGNESMCEGEYCNRQECLDFMATHLIRAFHDTSHHVRASVCACFTLLRSHDWVYIKERKPTVSSLALRLAGSRSNGAKQTTLSTTTPSLDSYARIFLQTPQDSSPVVRAAGFRLLGSLCLAPTFKTRELAIAVVNAALDALSDATLNVRVRAAWALGNVCTTPGPEAVMSTAVVGTGDDDGVVKWSVDAVLPAPLLVLYEILPAYQLRNIVEKMLIYIGDNDKVVSSVARTLGLVCRWAYFEPFIATVSSKEASVLQDLVGQMMIVLSTKINVGSPKVRWNACHAIAKVLLCPGLPLALIHWAPTVFQALISAIMQQENFKVRISACSALRVPVSRSAYGAFFHAALNATLDALETASDLKDVTEFRYKEQLETQLSFTLVHLVHVATVEDDDVVWAAMSAKSPSFLYDWLFHNLHRMTAAIEKESEVSLLGGQEGTGDEIGESGGGSGSGGSGGTEMHDVIPIKKDELLSAIRTLLRLLQNEDVARTYSKQCLSILYDAKLNLERDVLYSNEDLAFEF